MSIADLPFPSDAKGKMREAVFFDRDGVSIEDTGYLSDPADIRWSPGARRAVRLLADRGYLVFIVNCQSGVARGYYTEDAILRVHAAMQADLPPSARFADLAYCPHHPEGTVPAFTRVCDCRKPAPGMITELIER